MPSSVIATFRYRPGSEELEVTFRSGLVYAYQRVPARVAEAMARAFSKGEFFNTHIRDRYAFERKGMRKRAPISNG